MALVCDVINSSANSLNCRSANPSLLGSSPGARSFRLCTEGIEALERFERQASATQLRIAETRLEECVRLYPSDLVPKFYLGSVKTLTGYAGLDRAEELKRGCRIWSG